MAPVNKQVPRTSIRGACFFRTEGMKKWLKEPLIEAGVGKAVLVLVAALVAAEALPPSANLLVKLGLGIFGLL